MLYIPRSIKYCYHCGLFKPASDFPKNKAKKDGLSTECKTCNRARVQDWGAQHPEQVKQAKRRFVENNPTSRKLTLVRYYETHRDEQRQRTREYYCRNIDLSREKGRERARAAYAKNTGLVREKKKIRARVWRRSHPDWYSRDPGKWKIYVARRHARQRALPDTMTNQDWLVALNYFKDACAVCQKTSVRGVTIAADHWIALSDPRCPGTIPANIVPLCHGIDGCNNSKSNRPAKEWLVDRYGPNKAARILERIQTYFEWIASQH